MDNLGIFLTDASFDKKSSVSSISFIEKITQVTGNFQTGDISNIYEAELEGIRKCLKFAFRKFNNVVIVCDNKAAVFNAKKTFLREMNLKDRFSSVQFLWLPRDYLSEADFLTKNIDNEIENKNLKISGVIKKSKKNVLDIFVNEAEIYDIFYRKGQDLLKKIDISNIKCGLLIDIFNKKSIRSIDFSVDPILMKQDILYIINKAPLEGLEGSSLQLVVDYLYNGFKME